MLKAQAIGNLGSDPDLKYSTGGAAYLRFNLASNYRSKNEAGEWQDQTEWVRVTVFGTRAETLSQHLKKGSRVFIDGRLEARPWTDKQGENKAGLEIMADTVEFMSPRNEDGQPQAPRQARSGAPVATTLDGDLEDLPF